MKLLTGNQAVAHAVKNAEVEVVAAYPITPATPVIEEIAKMVDRGEFSARLILVESEHSAMAACIGATLAGSRSFTATSSHGLAYMHELLHFAVNSRAPVVLAVANRAIGPGWNIWADLSDSMSQRDTGWIQLYCESNQEIYDTIAMAYRIAESEEVLLPVMVCYDGFVLSHTSMPVELTDVREFVGKGFEWKVDFDDPATHGNILPPEYFMELRREIHLSHLKALEVMKNVEREFCEFSGRYTPLVLEDYMLEGAEVAIVTAGALSSEAKVAVEELRKMGLKAGLLRLKAFRPFPKREVAEMLKNVEEVFVFDRSASLGFFGQICSEVRASLFDLPSPPRVFGKVAGLGGRDVTYKVIKKAVLGKIEDDWILEVVP